MSGVRWLLPLGAIALLANCARPQLDITGANTGGQGGSSADDTALAEVLKRGVVVGRCGAADTLPDLAGVWAYRFETRATVSGGNLPDPIEETVTRYGVAEICQDGSTLQAVLVTCDFDQSPIYDDANECAAQLPGLPLLAALSESTLEGALSVNGPEAELVMGGWRETWGLEPGAALPPEAGDVDLVDSGALLDQDDDGDPGVTLEGDGQVPTVSWAARETVASFAFTRVGDTQLVGETRSAVAQTIIGGPATRALRGRIRQALPGDALFLRVDGRFAAPNLDTDGDGAVTCAELASLIGGALPAPRTPGCRR